jgi:hypothetical protein
VGSGRPAAGTEDKVFVWRQHGRFNVAVHSDAPPPDDEWDKVLELYRNQRSLRVLVYTQNGAPTAAQRVRLNAVLKGREFVVAVLTSSPLARAAGAALRWFRPEIRIFNPSELEAALDYLGATATERAELPRLLDELKARLGLATSGKTSHLNY